MKMDWCRINIIKSSYKLFYRSFHQRLNGDIEHIEHRESIIIVTQFANYKYRETENSFQSKHTQLNYRSSVP